jgi:hypothetical protein
MEGRVCRVRENEKPWDIFGKVCQSVFQDILVTFYSLGLGKLAPPFISPLFEVPLLRGAVAD